MKYIWNYFQKNINNELSSDQNGDGTLEAKLIMAAYFGNENIVKQNIRKLAIAIIFQIK